MLTDNPSLQNLPSLRQRENQTGFLIYYNDILCLVTGSSHILLCMTLPTVPCPPPSDEVRIQCTAALHILGNYSMIITLLPTKSLIQYYVILVTITAYCLDITTQLLSVGLHIVIIWQSEYLLINIYLPGYYSRSRKL